MNSGVVYLLGVLCFITQRCTQHVANQCATDTIISHTIWYLLIETEHLWACSVCSDVGSWSKSHVR